MRKAVSISSASEDSDQDFPSVEDVLTTTPKPRHRARNEEKQHSSNDEDSNNDLTTPRGSHLDKSRSLDAVRNLAQELFQTDKESNGSLEEVITPLRRKRLARRMSIDSPTPESSKRREDRDDHDEVMEDAAALEGNGTYDTKFSSFSKVLIMIVPICSPFYRTTSKPYAWQCKTNSKRC